MHTNSLGKSFGIAFLVTFIITAIILPLVLSGVAPIQQPFAVTFVRSLFGDTVPMPVGVAFHFVWVLFWSTLFFRYWVANPIRNAISLAGCLWLIQVLVFAPLVGWGVLGLGVAPGVVLPTLLPHTLFAVILAVAGVTVRRGSGATRE
ncbi:MAG: hypothetical protein WD049_08215 [Candidatus Paceibacterota bacterium]